MKLKRYQEEAVNKLLRKAEKLLQKDADVQMVFKSPTGSGKTIMMADFLMKLAEANLSESYSFIWASTNNLHAQSKEKLEDYMHESRYTFTFLDAINTPTFEENEIVFVNWESLTTQDRQGNWSNVLMRDGEKERNLPTLIRNTKNENREIILIVDESHNTFWSAQTQQLVRDIIGPKLIIEVSATPRIEVSSEEEELGNKAQVSVQFNDVVESGIIKSEIIINPEIGKYAKLISSSDDALVEAALAKRVELKKRYQDAGLTINPLVMVQLPSDSKSMSALDQSVKEKVVKILEKHDITIENGKLAIWLSEEKQNKEGIEANTAVPEVLIFKQAIALGWDCPRADVLVMLREMRSITFKIQTVGRVLRMPEAKHYDDDVLNKAYIFSNISSMSVEQDDQTRKYFKIFVAHGKKGTYSVKLPSIYLSRIDYGDLTLSFRKVFFEEANKRFKIVRGDKNEARYDKADLDLELYPDELKTPILADAVFKNIDAETKATEKGKKVTFDVREDEVKYRFEQFAKIASMPFAPVRSHTILQMAIYDWFDSLDAYKDKSRLVIQRAIVCSESNQKIFMEIIESAKDKFRAVKKKELVAKQRRKTYEWSVPAVDYFNDQYEKLSSKNYAQDACYVLLGRSDPEKTFEKQLNKNKGVEWWYKNGVSKEIFFAIPYADPTENVERGFYPDFIVKMKSGQIGLYDTKSGSTTSSDDTAAKSDALQAYILKNKKLKLIGGIVNVDKAGMKMFVGAKYNKDTKSKDWKSF